MYRSKSYIPFSQRLVRGAIGKRCVIKHYKHGVVKTKYPDMSAIVASEKQRACRDSFTAFNAIVKAIYNDPIQRQQWKIKLGNPPHLYQAIFKTYRKEIEEAKIQRLHATNRLIRKSFKEVSKIEVFCYVEVKLCVGTVALGDGRVVEVMESG